jgi:hypothetical protein
MGRHPMPIEEKRKRGTLRMSRLPESGLEEIPRLPIVEGIPAPPERLGPRGREFWGQAFEGGNWLWGDIDGTLLAHTGELLDERDGLSKQVRDNPDNTRLRAALRQLDKQLVSNLAHLGFTPSGRANLGLVRVRQQSKLEEMMAFRHSRDQRIEEERLAREKGKI